MSSKTGISWTDATWNPVRGCSRVSEGCRHCYAEQQAARIVRMGKGKPTGYDGLVSVRSQVSGMRYKDVNAAGDFDEARWTGEVRMVPEHLADPLRWKKPRRIFVNSMSDLFHEKLTNEQIAAVFGVMAVCPQHTLQILTKRAKRMREWFEWINEQREVDGDPWVTCLRETISSAPGDHAIDRHMRENVDHHTDFDVPHPWPLPNVWLGVSVENQEAADERIPELLDTPAAIRFLSCEPLIGDVDLFAFLKGELRDRCLPKLGASGPVPGVDWVIAGCESGPGARECKVEWLRAIRDRCAAAGVAFFLKQAEESTDLGKDRLLDIGDDDSIAFDDGSKMKARRPGGHHIIELPYLDGVQHAAFPVPA